MQHYFLWTLCVVRCSYLPPARRLCNDVEEQIERKRKICGDRVFLPSKHSWSRLLCSGHYLRNVDSFRLFFFFNYGICPITASAYSCTLQRKMNQQNVDKDTMHLRDTELYIESDHMRLGQILDQKGQMSRVFRNEHKNQSKYAFGVHSTINGWLWDGYLPSIFVPNSN